jgi:hypothetical protein
MKTLLATLAVAGGVTIAGFGASPALAIPFGPSPLVVQDAGSPITEVRWVCTRNGRDCVWRGPQRRVLYYGPRNWQHCDFRWRTGPRGPYRERICW